MKRFLIALLFCLVPFSARAYSMFEFLVDVYRVYDSIFGEKKEENPDLQFIKQYISEMYAGNLTRIDEELRGYIDPDDFEYAKEHTDGFYKIVNNSKASYIPSINIISVDTGFTNIIAKYESISVQLPDSLQLSLGKAEIQHIMHHEVQHLKDSVKMEEYGYNSETLLNDLDKVSQMFFGGILEARAYTEEIEFLYSRKNDLYKRMEELKAGKEEIQSLSSLAIELNPKYDEIKELIDETLHVLGKNNYVKKEMLADAWGRDIVSIDNLDFLYEQVKIMYREFEREYQKEDHVSALAFKKAIEENNSIEEDRRAAAVALLNSDWFKNGYMIGSYSTWPFGDLHISPEKIIQYLGEDYFTVEDFYGLDDFWKNACNNRKSTNSAECQAFWMRYETKYCPNLKEKWGDCAHVYEIAMVEKKCETCKEGMCFEHPRRRLINNEDVDSYKNCCHDVTYSPLTGTTKEDMKVIEENANLTNAQLVRELFEKESRDAQALKIYINMPNLEDKYKKPYLEKYEEALEKYRKAYKIDDMTREELLREKFKERENPFE